MALLHGIDQQDAPQPLALLSPIDSKVAEKNAWDPVRARCPRGSSGRHVGHANGMGIDGVEAQAGPRFATTKAEASMPNKSAAASMLAFTEGLVH